MDEEWKKQLEESLWSFIQRYEHPDLCKDNVDLILLMGILTSILSIVHVPDSIAKRHHLIGIDKVCNDVVEKQRSMLGDTYKVSACQRCGKDQVKVLLHPECIRCGDVLQ